MIYARIAGIVLTLAALISLGWWLGSRSWETKYNALQAENWKGEYQRQKDVADDLRKKLDDATATNKRNAGIIGDLHDKLATADTDHDRLTGQLRNAFAAASRPRGCAVPQATNQSGTPAAAQASGAGQTPSLPGLVADAMTEAKRNVLSGNALLEQLIPQLEQKP